MGSFLSLVFTNGWLAPFLCHQASTTPKATTQQHDCSNGDKVRLKDSQHTHCEKSEDECQYNAIKFNGLVKEIAKAYVVDPPHYSSANSIVMLKRVKEL